VRIAPASILVGAAVVTLLLVLGGVTLMAFGVAGLLFFGSTGLMPIALVGLLAFVGGLFLAIKVVRPGLRLAKED
jgi:hypothetical protein